jgi:hypothetical protein
VGKPEGRGLLERPRCRWEGNIQMDLENVGWSVRTEFIWHRVGTVASCGEEGNKHSGSIKCRTFCK